MDISSYVLLSQEQALRRRLDVAANNMANMSTAGFKRERPVFREYVEQQTEAAVEQAAVDRGRRFTRDRLQESLNSQASGLEKKGGADGTAPAAASDATTAGPNAGS